MIFYRSTSCRRRDETRHQITETWCRESFSLYAVGVSVRRRLVSGFEESEFTAGVIAADSFDIGFDRIGFESFTKLLDGELVAVVFVFPAGLPFMGMDRGCQEGDSSCDEYRL